MVYAYFVSYMLIGFAVSLVVFFWALGSGQFRDQDRARFLPLTGEPEAPSVKKSKIGRLELYALLSLACIGLLTTGAVLVFALVKAG